MFTNIGNKIKMLAKTLFYIGVVLSAIGGIVTMVTIGGFLGFLIGLLAIGVGFLAAWLGSFFTYGFGELIDKTAETARNTEILAQIALQGQKTPKQ